MHQTTLERAFELARTGEYSGLAEIKAQLLSERRPDVHGQLFGPTLARSIRSICIAARKDRAPDGDATAPGGAAPVHTPDTKPA